MRPFVSGLVLAAGASTRVGQPKQLLPLGSTTLLGAVIAHATTATSLDQVVVVIGAAAARVREHVDFGQATVVENPEFGDGCASSYRTGIAALDPRAEAVAVLLGDQPEVTASVIDTVVAEWRRAPAPVMLASYRGREGHPLLFSRTLFDVLVGLRGDKAAWKIVDQHRSWMRSVPLDHPHPRDVNTWSEYLSLRSAPR